MVVGGVSSNQLLTTSYQLPTTLTLPNTQQSSDHQQLAQMVGIVVRYQQSFAQNSLPVTPRNPGVEVSFGISYQILHAFQVGAKLLHALLPGGRAGRSFTFRPILIGEFRRNMFRTAAEFHNVPLRDAHVLQQTPRRVRLPLRLLAPQALGKVFYHLVKFDVRVPALQQVEKVLAQRLLVIVFCHDECSLRNSSETAPAAGMPGSGCSPWNTLPIPRTTRRIGSSLLLSAKKISPARLLR